MSSIEVEDVSKSTHYKNLVSSIQETFNGSDKVTTILKSLNDLFAVFDSENGRKFRGELDPSVKNGEREMLLGVITVLLDHLIKGTVNVKLDNFFTCSQLPSNCLRLLPRLI